MTRTATAPASAKPNAILRAPEITLAGIMVLVVVLAALGGANVSGLLASMVAFVVWLPQARSVWAARNDPHALSSHSVSTQVLLLSNAVLWGVYAAQESAFWVAAPGIINAPLAILCIVLIFRSRRQAKAPADVTCQHCLDGREHCQFITAPAGWGTVVDCTGTPRHNAVTVFNEEDVAALRTQRP